MELHHYRVTGLIRIDNQKTVEVDEVILAGSSISAENRVLNLTISANNGCNGHWLVVKVEEIK